MEKINAVLRVAYGVEPNTLTTEDWARLFQEWVYVKRTDLKAQELILKNSLREVIYEVVNKLYAKK